MGWKETDRIVTDYVNVIRAKDARIEELERERDDFREKWVRDTGKLVGYAETQEDRAEAAEAEVARLSALLREAEDGVRKARLSLSQAARDFHAQQAEDSLFYVASRLEARLQEPRHE